MNQWHKRFDAAYCMKVIISLSLTQTLLLFHVYSLFPAGQAYIGLYYWGVDFKWTYDSLVNIW